MTGTVAHIVRILDRLAPPRLAKSWDNVGLQLGNPSWPVHKVWTALDPLPEVVARACENDVDVLVTHHPLFFKPVQRIDCGTSLGRIVEMALSRKLAIFSAHTNLDSVTGGVNDVLADRIGLSHLGPLGDPVDADRVKLVVFVPSTHEQVILDTLYALDAGRIGNYRCCSFRCEGTGTFLPEDDATPAIGKMDTLTEVKESRIEIIVAQDDLNTVVDGLKKAHPYETMAYDVYPLSVRDQRAGLGRVGKLLSPMPLDALSGRLKAALNLSTVKVVGEPDLMVETVAVCSGSGSSLMTAAIASGAQAYVSGDLGYHTARDAQQADIGLIDIGHFASEHLVVDVLAASIRNAINASGLTASVEAVDTETDPFHYL
jgi:dinuclear metal center YbgI/SA1388 family protein